MDFFTALNFSSSNEDGATEVAALRGARRILCITGSGTRPLDLLQTDAPDIVAYDINPAQNAMLALKIAAIGCLDHRSYLTFLGILPGPRMELYQRIRPNLTDEMQRYWGARTHLISKGIWYAGKWEKILGWNARALRLFRGKAVKALMTAPDIESQAAIWDAQFTDGRLRRAIELLGRDWVWRRILREPGGAFLPAPEAVAARLAEAFQSASGRFLFRDSDFATLVFCGRHSATGGLPVHLRLENYAHTQANLGRIQIVEGNLTSIRARGVEQVDGFSLSDFGSYTDPKAYAACWSGIIDAAAPGARFCERIFMNDLDLPFAVVEPDIALSARLSVADRAIIYRIRAGGIAKGTTQ